ncbi:N-acetylmannosamine-6-phosphate 2-epimerase [Streptomyces sp. NPDC000880]
MYGAAEGQGSHVVGALRGGVVVSCQASSGHPFSRPHLIAAMAECAERGGATAVRIEGEANVRHVADAVTIPVLGIMKVQRRGQRPFITPDFEHCQRLVEAGAALVAIEAANDYRPDPDEFATLCARVKSELGVPVMADVSTFVEGVAAADAGADLVATTLAGYTSVSPARSTPDLELLGELAATGVRTVLEGHVRHPEEITEAFRRGAWSAVVGTAITDPLAITGWFVSAARGAGPVAVAG